ncbi:hypothetical protein SEA_ARAXXI_45 [Microbacterium phage Araxxi]|uniref:Uncharacterized protein n=1 Tax=Microbacterium phage Araxxi TaxID=2590948 RepID=A0A516KT46_9CAUD|nr:hypothetical protein HWC57_gp45 [Microbacterium phage Araxxi]QDP44864.1 hypothetical protein SEA_ARAXXI_45 [Microbacterium phage Araxxi]
MAKAQRRLILLQAETDHQLLLLKELQQEQERLTHRMQEQTESLQWHQEQVTSPPATPEPTLLLSPRELALGSPETPPSSPTTGPLF